MKEDLPIDNLELVEEHNEAEDIIEGEFHHADGNDQDSTTRDSLINNYFSR